MTLHINNKAIIEWTEIECWCLFATSHNVVTADNEIKTIPFRHCCMMLSVHWNIIRGPTECYLKYKLVHKSQAVVKYVHEVGLRFDADILGQNSFHPVHPYGPLSPYHSKSEVPFTFWDLRGNWRSASLFDDCPIVFRVTCQNLNATCCSCDYRSASVQDLKAAWRSELVTA